MHWVNDPKEWHKKGIEDEHDGFFMDDTVGMLVVIIEGDRLDSQGHYGGGEEQSETVF